MSNDCLAFLAHLGNDTSNVSSIVSVLIVHEFDVFPADLLGMPLDRDIYICIDLELETRPISISPYRMSPTE